MTISFNVTQVEALHRATLVSKVSRKADFLTDAADEVILNLSLLSSAKLRYAEGRLSLSELRKQFRRLNSSISVFTTAERRSLDGSEF